MSKPRRDQMCKYYLTLDEKQALEKYAKHTGKPMTRVAREALLKEIGFLLEQRQEAI
jgi:hypothetical protein